MQSAIASGTLGVSRSSAPMASAASLPACWACSMSAGVSLVGGACSSHSAVCS
jgi:hypothetical protein